MSFDHLWALNFLWVLPLIVLAMIFALRKKRLTLEKFADNKLLSKLTGEEKKEKIYLKIFLLIFSTYSYNIRACRTAMGKPLSGS